MDGKKKIDFLMMEEELKKIVRLAGEQVLKIYDSQDFGIETKKDKSLVTKADLTVNKIVIDGLRKISEYPILTEESYVDYKKRKNWQKFWLVDPLDGTKDFIAKNGEFTINISLIDKHRPVIGVIYIPIWDTIYYAEVGRGAFKNSVKIYNNSDRSELIGVDSRFHSTAETTDFFKRNNIKIIKKYGSAIKFGKLAEGEIDVYPRFNGTKEWDTAAGQIIVNEAGCKVIDYMGQEILYNKEKIENNFFIASRKNLSFI